MVYLGTSFNGPTKPHQGLDCVVVVRIDEIALNKKIEKTVNTTSKVNTVTICTLNTRNPNI